MFIKRLIQKIAISVRLNKADRTKARHPKSGRVNRRSKISNTADETAELSDGTDFIHSVIALVACFDAFLSR